MFSYALIKIFNIDRRVTGIEQRKTGSENELCKNKEFEITKMYKLLLSLKWKK